MLLQGAQMGAARGLSPPWHLNLITDQDQPSLLLEYSSVPEDLSAKLVQSSSLLGNVKVLLNKS